ncbi:MAG: radical SAM protein [Roseburia sp.]
MEKIYYYNINYNCNNDCRFCFSSSTGENANLVPKISILDATIGISADDTVVLNGGEPTIHPEFYGILNDLIEKRKCKIVVYSNGRSIDVSRIANSDRLRFVIPVHGDEKTHDYITQRKGAFSDTLSTIRELNRNGFCVNIKFIISQELLRSSFSIKKFLEKESLSSDLIIIARLNNTKKSVLNGVEPVNLISYKKYISEVFLDLKDICAIMFLDTPICYLPGFNAKKIPIVPRFCFSDYQHKMDERKYYKEICIEENCDLCESKALCKLLSSSYLTVYYDKEWIIKSE